MQPKHQQSTIFSTSVSPTSDKELSSWIELFYCSPCPLQNANDFHNNVCSLRESLLNIHTTRIPHTQFLFVQTMYTGKDSYTNYYICTTTRSTLFSPANYTHDAPNSTHEASKHNAFFDDMYMHMHMHLLLYPLLQVALLSDSELNRLQRLSWFGLWQSAVSGNRWKRSLPLRINERTWNWRSTTSFWY